MPKQGIAIHSEHEICTICKKPIRDKPFIICLENGAYVPKINTIAHAECAEERAQKNAEGK